MQPAARMVAHAQGRRRWRAKLALTLLIGLAAGVAMALVAGARRSSTVVDRFLSTAHVYQASVVPQPWGPTRAQLLGLPGVTRADPAAYVAASVVGEDGRVVAGTNGVALDLQALDPTARILAGSVPDAADPTGVLVNPSFVRRFGQSVGDTVTVRTFGTDQADQVGAGVYEPTGPEYTMHIRGVVSTPDDIAGNDVRNATSASGDQTQIAFQDAFYEDHRAEFLDFGNIYNVALERGPAGRDALLAAVAALAPAGADPAAVLPPQVTQRSASLAAPVRVETAALLLLGIGVGLAAAVATALVLRAEARLHDGDTLVVRALGGTAHLLGLAGATRTAPVALGGAVLATVTAIALSARFPIGIGRQLELHGGYQADGLVLAGGILVVVGVVLGSAYAFGRPRRTRAAQARPPRTVVARLAGMGAPVDAVVAAHLAFDRGPTVRRTPARGAIAGGAVLLAAITAIAVYVSGIDHLYRDPGAHGWNWDAVVGNTNFALGPQTAARLDADARVVASTKAGYASATVDGRSSELLAYDPLGGAPPRVIQGRLPVGAGEIALGGDTLRRSGAHVGSTVTVQYVPGSQDGGEPPAARQFAVVGTSLAPAFGDADVGDIGIVSFAGAQALGAPTDPQLVLVRLGSGRSRAVLDAVDRDYTEEITTDIVPAKVLTLHRVRSVPLAGLAVAAAMGLFVLVYALALSVRVRTRDLAVLRALGLSSRRVRRVLAWLGVLLATGMAVVGLPLGLVLGTAMWRGVATGLGVPTTLTLSPRLLLAVPPVLAVAIAASWVAGRRAARPGVAALLVPE